MSSSLSKDQQDALWSTYESLARLVAKGDKLSSLSAKKDLERRYGRAYQALVKAGLAQQIKFKYRRT